MTKLFLLLGNPVSHSLSPCFWNKTFKKLGIDATYVALKVEEDDINVALHGIKALGVSGINVTIPYKQAAAKVCSVLHGAASVIGVVNTLKLGKNGFEGWNTDYYGLRSVLGGFAGFENALVIGSGASSQTALQVLSEIKCKQAYQIARKYSDTIYEKNNEMYLTKFAWNSKNFAYSVSESDIIINTTPLGWKPEDDIPELRTYLTSDKTYMDFNYSSCSSLIQAASEKNCKVIDGLELLLRQGMESFKIFTGVCVPDNIMREALYSCVR